MQPLFLRIRILLGWGTTPKNVPRLSELEGVIGIESEKGTLIAISRRFADKNQRIQRIWTQRQQQYYICWI
ncbi:MAG: hypothetical protein GY850_12160 [bacterium]|nr:hypothetical protein [bacterium]